MDLEEQRLKHHLEIRQEALKEKVNMLKERIEHFKRMADLEFQVEERPGLMFMGSILAGYITKKLVTGKNRHPANTYRTNSQMALAPMPASAAGRFWDPVGVIVSALVSRIAIGVSREIVKKLMSRRHEERRSGQNVRNN